MATTLTLSSNSHNLDPSRSVPTRHWWSQQGQPQAASIVALVATGETSAASASASISDLVPLAISWCVHHTSYKREPSPISRTNRRPCNRNENNCKVESLRVVVTGLFSWAWGLSSTPMEIGYSYSGHATQKSNQWVVNFDNGVYYFKLYQDGNGIRSTVELCRCLLVCTVNVQGKLLFRWNRFGGNGNGNGSSSRVNSSQRLCLGITE